MISPFILYTYEWVCETPVRVFKVEFPHIGLGCLGASAILGAQLYYIFLTIAFETLCNACMLLCCVALVVPSPLHNCMRAFVLAFSKTGHGH